MERLETLIIGSGPAGYTAAIYAARADLKPVLYTGLEPGGQLTTTTDVDNFPGYPKGIDGPTMMIQLKEQAERFGTDVRIGHVKNVKLSKKIGKLHKVIIEDGSEIETKTIIITCGTFLSGTIHIGGRKIPAGRMGELRSEGITENLISLGFKTMSIPHSNSFFYIPNQSNSRFNFQCWCQLQIRFNIIYRQITI